MVLQDLGYFGLNSSIQPEACWLWPVNSALFLCSPDAWWSDALMYKISPLITLLFFMYLEFLNKMPVL